MVTAHGRPGHRRGGRGRLLPTDQTLLHDVQSPWWRPNLGSSLEDPTGATPESEPELYLLASPTSHVDSADPPTFLAHGAADQWAPPEQSELPATLLEEAGVPHRLIELPGARHGFDAVWGGWSSQIVSHELEGYLEQHLADQEPHAR